jgi:alanine dehydrogenase
MRVGVPKEIKNHEYRVGLTPTGVRELVNMGHEVWVEHNCGAAIGLSDDLYHRTGAKIVSNSEEVFANAELVVKVKEPQPNECVLLSAGQILFTYLHLAPDPFQTELLLRSGASCIAYETVTSVEGGLPLLAPMSEVAGRMSIQAAARCLEKAQGGSGVLLGGVPGVEAANVMVLGGGVVGLNAARMALGLGAKVIVFDRNLARLKYIDEVFNGQIKTLYSTEDAIEKQLPVTDVVIGAVLVPGATAPKLLSREMLGLMQAGSVVVDVAIDQGGCFATSQATSHQNPTYIVDDIVHYCVANMPGAVARTSTFALTNATLPYVISLARDGLKSLKNVPGFLAGLNAHRGMVTCKGVAEAQSLNYFPPEDALGVGPGVG